MYDAELKTKFIRGYTKSINTANVASTVFDSLEKYEEAWGADLCTRTKEELQPVIDETVALRSRSQWTALTILREYAKWCMAMKVPGACDGMLRIESVGLDKVHKQMVSSPLHLQQYMDTVFDGVDENTIDVIYRCYYWMAYAGIREKDTIYIKVTDVDFPNMEIVYGDTHVPLYRESLPAMHKAVELNSFFCKHPNYTKPVLMDRLAGDTLMRGIKAPTKILTVRTTLSKKSAKAIEQGRTSQQLSFNRIWMSGLFYRMYERERAGLPVDFSDAVAEFMSGKEYSLKGRIKLEHKKNRMERDYMEDYQRWKLAFSV